jgi:hypothetical protein
MPDGRLRDAGQRVIHGERCWQGVRRCCVLQVRTNRERSGQPFDLLIVLLMIEPGASVRMVRLVVSMDDRAVIVLVTHARVVYMLRRQGCRSGQA